MRTRAAGPEPRMPECGATTRSHPAAYACGSDHLGGGLAGRREISHTDVVKTARDASAVTDQATGPVGDRRTRDRVTRLLLAQGGATAAELGAKLGLSPAAIRRHLDAMLANGDVVVRDRPARGPRGRGRPARVYQLTEQARRRCGRHAYDDIAAA